MVARTSAIGSQTYGLLIYALAVSMVAAVYVGGVRIQLGWREHHASSGGLTPRRGSPPSSIDTCTQPTNWCSKAAPRAPSRLKHCVEATNWCAPDFVPPAEDCSDVRRQYYDGCWRLNSDNVTTKWLPKTCSPPDVLASHTAVVQALASLPATRWIYFMGDSSTRGLFCELAELVAADPGSGVNFTDPIYGCDPPQTGGAAEREFSFTVGNGSASGNTTKVSWTYGYEISDSAFTSRLTEVLAADARPDVIVVNSGVWEHVKNWEAVFGMGVADIRGVGARYILHLLKAAKFEGLLIYRNNICNVRFDAAMYDSLVDPEFGAKGPVATRLVDAFAISLGRVEDSTYDGFHMDRTAWDTVRHLWQTKPNVGALNRAILSGILLTIREYYSVL